MDIVLKFNTEITFGHSYLNGNHIRRSYDKTDKIIYYHVLVGVHRYVTLESQTIVQTIDQTLVQTIYHTIV